VRGKCGRKNFLFASFHDKSKDNKSIGESAEYDKEEII
jgi:hypothetical protein